LIFFCSTHCDDSVRPFKIEISDDDLKDLQTRLQKTILPISLDEEEPWKRGMDLAYTKELLEYWKTTYDWRAHERKLNEMEQFKTTIDGLEVHFVHVRSKQPNAEPLLLVHGWPGSFLECSKVLPMLVDPLNHGGSADDAFHFVCPSLPGYGFSQHGGLDQKEVADLFAKLMLRLGYSRFWVQGGDWGSLVVTLLAYHHPDLILGLHSNFPLLSFPRGITGALWTALTYLAPSWTLTASDQAAFKKFTVSNVLGLTGYLHLQATKPQTIAYALTDSPIGLATYIIEKFYEWSDCRGQLESSFTKDELLTNVMIYWFSRSIGTSLNFYYEFFDKDMRSLISTLYVKVPCAFANFNGEKYPGQVRSFVEYTYNIQRWTVFEDGGHFAALEEPVLFVNDIRAFRSQLRKDNKRTDL